MPKLPGPLSALRGRLSGPPELPDSKGRFVASIPNEIIQYLSEIKCTACKAEFINNEHIYLSPCGHLFCSRCATNQSPPVYNNSKQRAQRFTCEACESNNQRFDFGAVEECDKYGLLKFTLLRDLNEYLLDDAGTNAYQCTICKQFHPPDNIVVCDGCLVETEDGSFICVWCAKDFHKTCRLRLTQPLIVDMPTTRLNGEKLSSIERSRSRMFGLSLLYCASNDCQRLLRDKDDLVLPLHCTHLSHWKCAKKFLRDGIPCHFCAAQVPIEPNMVFGKDFLRKFSYAEDVSGRMGAIFDCHGRCKKPHPSQNRVMIEGIEYCVWCALESRFNC